MKRQIETRESIHLLKGEKSRRESLESHSTKTRSLVKFKYIRRRAENGEKKILFM